MRSLRKLVPTLAVIALTGWGASACGSDGVSAPDQLLNSPLGAASARSPGAREADASTTGATTSATASALRWSKELRTRYSSSALVHRSAGSVITIPGTGFRLTIPANALPSDTLTITVTAVPGSAVAYEFAPHGVHFLAPLIFSQDLSSASYSPGMQLMGAYFEDAASLRDPSRVPVAEQMSATVTGGRVQFHIAHFSGYMVSSF